MGDIAARKDHEDTRVKWRQEILITAGWVWKGGGKGIREHLSKKAWKTGANGRLSRWVRKPRREPTAGQPGEDRKKLYPLGIHAQPAPWDKVPLRSRNLGGARVYINRGGGSQQIHDECVA